MTMPANVRCVTGLGRYACNMRRRRCSIALLVLSAASPQPASEPIRYVLAPELTRDAVTALRIKVRFRADPFGTTDIGWDGERKLWQWARDFEVEGASAVVKTGDGHWRIASAPGAPLTANYRILSAYNHDPTVDDSDQPRPVIRPDWFYAMGNA